MTVTIEQSYINTFSSNIMNLVEQKTAALKGIFGEEFKTGEKHFFERLGSFTATEIVSRMQATEMQDPSHSRRMATVKVFGASVGFDILLDKIKLLIDPLSDYAMKLASAHGRVYDSEVIDAIIGNAQTDKTGSTAVALPSGQKIAHGSAGLTVAKLHSALKNFKKNFIDPNTTDVFLIVGAEGVEDLYTDTSNVLTSFDFQAGKPISDGSMPKFRGVNIVSSELIPDITPGSQARALLVTRAAVKVAVSDGLTLKTAELPTNNFNTLISSYSSVGAVRMEEEQVVEIAYNY